MRGASAIAGAFPCRKLDACRYKEVEEHALRTIAEGEARRLLGINDAADEPESSLLEEVLDATPEATAIAHHGRVLHVNREFVRLFGYGSAECVGQELVELVVPEGRVHECEMMLHTLRQSGRAAMETRRRTQSGEEIDVCVLMARLRLGGHAMGMLVTYRDIRGQKQEAARLQHSARHDSLTGLANRVLFLETVSLTLSRLRRRPDRSFAVIFLDLDGFKQVNDTLGHAAGDALLLELAARLRRCLRPQDTVARFGGDEFALLLDDSGNAAEVQAVAARIQAEIKVPIVLNGAEAKVSASIGIAIAKLEYGAAEELMVHADSAMYAAKTAGGGRHVVYGC
jgi:Amt family ammonium transporter